MSAYIDITFYLIGLITMLVIFTPFSPMTIDLVNFSRDTQIAIYRHRHKLWAIGIFSLGLVLLRSLDSVMGAQSIDQVDKWFWITIATIGALTMMFWSGYVPYVMTPPSKHKILTAKEADQILKPDDVILGLAYGDEVRAYLRDEIARPHYFKDTLNKTPLTVSYCILCNSGAAYNSELNGQALNLRCVTAYNNNVIYYDPATGNFIQQLDGSVVYGPDKGKSLEAYPVVMASWEEWKNAHPDTKFFSSPPITLRDKMVGLMLGMMIPISKLSKRTKPWHRIQGKLDPRLPAMSFVYGIDINGDARAYSLNKLKDQRVINEEVGGKPIVVVYDGQHDVGGIFSAEVDSQKLTFEALTEQDNSVIARDQETGSLWTATGKSVEGPLKGQTLKPVSHINKLFWFSWALFKPHTKVSDPKT
ncbi:MAG: DUF3179 domain-containing (seleno)protein [Methylophaga sp.]|nr:DUF3179 domain-containing (seleno)protein [Methylophaga sp.]